MWVAKLEDGRLVQVLKYGAVQFDARPGWLLIGMPIDARPRRQDIRWIHPDATPIVWLRQFKFEEESNVQNRDPNDLHV